VSWIISRAGSFPVRYQFTSVRTAKVWMRSPALTRTAQPRSQPNARRRVRRADGPERVFGKPRNGRSHDRPDAQPRPVGRNCRGRFALGFTLVRQSICCFRNRVQRWSTRLGGRRGFPWGEPVAALSRYRLPDPRSDWDCEMFNTQLKAKLDALCSDLAAHLDTSETAGGARAGMDGSSSRP
jgi:hypothetical protein